MSATQIRHSNRARYCFFETCAGFVGGSDELTGLLNQSFAALASFGPGLSKGHLRHSRSEAVGKLDGSYLLVLSGVPNWRIACLLSKDDVWLVSGFPRFYRRPYARTAQFDLLQTCS